MKAPLSQLPWYHHIANIQKLSEPEARLWYAAAAVEHGWSRNVPVHQIESQLHTRAGKNSDLADQLTKDPYIFDFVTMTDNRNERELEGQLISC